MRARIGLGVLLLLAAIAGWLLWPPAALAPRAVRVAHSREQALARLQVLAQADTAALTSGCGTFALVPAARAPRAFVLLHGITNCPLQFAALAESLHARGDAVIVPRVPHHGLANRMTTELAALRADEMTALVTECVGVARGLGDTVVVMGLSTSGVIAAWAGQVLPGVDRAVVIAPALAPPWQPAPLGAVAARLAMRLPNQFVWWDDEKREALGGPAQCYPRFATRAMGEVYVLAGALQGAAARERPVAHDLVLVTTAADEAVSLPAVRALAELWRARGAAVREVEFPREERVVHDMVDPAQVGARIESVYPVLLALARGEALPVAGGALERSAVR